MTVIERPNFKRRIPELDGLRGIAILQVIYWHYIEPGQIPRYLSAFGRLTWSGVDLFFVLSGFLIGGILLDARTSKNFFKTFYVRRFYRILPLYIFLLLALWLGVSLSTGTENPALSWLFFYLPIPWYFCATLTQNFWSAYHGTLGGPPFLSPTWSLAIEEQFYLMLPCVIRFLKPSRLPYFLAAVIVIAPLLRTVLYLAYDVPGGWAGYVLMPCRADALMLGVGAALLVRSRAGWNYLVTHRRVMNLILGILFLGMVWAAHKKWLNVTTFEMSSFGYTWVALFYLSVLLIAVSQPTHLISRALRNRALRGIGIIAYGAYLFHIPVEGLCYALLRGHNVPPTNAADFATSFLAFGLTLIFAAVSWFYFEKPLVRRGHRYKYEGVREQELDLMPQPS
jgi:peptidoglycan/LPS O-acetylase OafA/YrhL